MNSNARYESVGAGADSHAAAGRRRGPPLPLTIDTLLVSRAMRVRGRARGAVMQFSAVKMTDAVTMDGHAFVPALA